MSPPHLYTTIILRLATRPLRGFSPEKPAIIRVICALGGKLWSLGANQFLTPLSRINGP